MATLSNILIVLVLFPMVSSCVGYLLGRRWEKGRDIFLLACVLLEVLLVVALLGGEPCTVELAGIFGLGLTFASGGLHTVLAMLAATGWLAATVLSREYFAHVSFRNRYYVFWMLTLGATMGVFLSNDLYTMFIFFEIMSLTSYVAVVQTETPQALEAGETYLAVAVIGGLVTLSGLFLLYFQLGTLSIPQLAQAGAEASSKGLLWVGGLLSLVGFAAKAGAFPLHIWLPTAHPAAPAPASAVLSGVITKTGIYGVAILSTTLFLHRGDWGVLLLGVGVITMVWGAVLAVCSVDLKRTLACSSVSQMGFIFIGLGMQGILGSHNALAVDGTILHILNHSLVKMVLFPAAGIIYLTTHSFDLNEIRGFGRKKPLLALIMGIPMLTLAGVPMLSGYVSKTLLHESIVEYIPMVERFGGLFVVLEWLFLISGGLTVAYMLKLFICIFVEENRLPPAALAQKWRGSGAGYIAPASACVLVVYGMTMAVLGAVPNLLMDGISAFARNFFYGHPPAHAVAYFSTINLTGAAISLSIGVAVYLIIVRGWLIQDNGAGERHYCDPLPTWLNLENGFYRPALKQVAKVMLVLAVFADRIGFRLLFRGLPNLCGCGYRWVLNRRGMLVQLLTGAEYIPRPSLEQVVDDHHFGRYTDKPKKERGVIHSLAFGLLLTGLGLVFAIGFVLLRSR